MTLYRVIVTEEHTWNILVDAEDSAEAEAEAEELAADFDPDDVTSDAYAIKVNVSKISPNEDVWVGGEDGEFVTYAEYTERDVQA